MAGAISRSWIYAAGAMAIVLACLSNARAGTIESGIGGCDLNSSFSGCEWKPLACFRPSKPVTTAYDVESYNIAVEEYNSYVQQMSRYLDCLVSEAKRDIATGFPNAVKKSVEELSDDAQSEVSNAKSDLDLARELIRR
jgi:hypothetical protein